jgi:flagellar motor switch protein FliM
MKKVLSQKEIDDMIRVARSSPEAPVAAAVVPPVAILWDGRLASQIGRKHMQALSRLHETFARNLSHSISAYLRIQFQAALASAEYLTYGQFLQGIPEVTYLASCKLTPAGISILMQLDLAVAFPLIDVLLGGEGKGSPPMRGITEIEEQILESVMHILCRELQSAWQALSLEFQFEQRQHPGQVEQLIATAEKILLLNFEITVLESRGTLNLVVPALVSNALLRKFSDRSAARPRPRIESDRRLRLRLLDCPFDAELIMPSLKVPLRALAELAQGGVLNLGRSSQHPATLVVAGQEMFSARVARHGPRRAAHVLTRSVMPDAAGKRNS